MSTELRTLVEAGIYRSGQPTEQDLRDFRKLGGRCVISLVGDDKTEGEALLVEELGMHWVSIPLSGFFPPKDADIAHILAQLDFPVLHPVLVHCKHGVDRTGMVIAIWRIEHGWTVEQAQAEADAHHMSWVSFFMRSYIEEWAEKQAKPASEPK